MGAVAFVYGFRAGRRGAHAGLYWVDDIPRLYVPVFYNADSLYYYIEKAYLLNVEDPEAMGVVGTAAYNLRLFDKRALDTLPAVSLEEADMLLGAAWKGYYPAYTVIHYLDQLDLWCHSVPEVQPLSYPNAPVADVSEYTYMIVK